MNARGALMTALFILCGLAILAASFGLRERFSQGAQARREICREISVIKQILYDEHKAKLRGTQKYLRKHPDGAPSIDVSRQDLLDSIAVERQIVNDTRPKKCP